MHVQDVKEKLRRDFLSAYVAELAVWPAFQAANFALVGARHQPCCMLGRQADGLSTQVPVRHQLLMVNLACLGDATFLCWCAC